MRTMTASEARQTSDRNRVAAAARQRRKALAKKRAEAAQEAEYQARHAKELRKEYEDALAKAIKAGNHSFRIRINTIYDRQLNFKEFMAEQDDAEVLRSIWRSLRVRGYKVTVSVKAEHHSGVSLYEGIDDRDPYWSYTYTAKVSW